MGTIAPGGLVATHAPVPAGSQGNVLQARADTAYSTEWDMQEQATLDAALARYPADRHPPLERYVRAAASLPKKNVRDVALRVAWMRATAAARKRKAVDEANSKKQVRRERGQSIFAVQPKAMGASVGPHPMAQHSMAMGMGVAPTANMGMVPGMATPGSSMIQPPGMAFAQPVPMALVSQLDDHGAGTVGVVGGPLSQLLEQNYAILNQFKQNMEVYKVNENTELLVRFRDNILTVLNQMNAMQGVMQQMPPLPVRLNVELANNFLPKAVANGVCQVPYMAAPMPGMPAVPAMGSAAMPQASMPYNAVSAAAAGFTAPLVTPQPGVNGVSAAAPVVAAPASLPTSAPRNVPTTLPTSMPAMDAAQQPGIPAPGALSVQVAAVKQEPGAQAQPGQAPVPMKVEPGVTAPGSMPMPAGPAASAALSRPPPPVNTMYYPPSSAPSGLAAHVAAAPITSMPPSSAAPAVQLPTAQQQQQQQRTPAISAGMVDPTKAHLDALFPCSAGAQPAVVQDNSASAGGLYDVLASITANTPGMLQPAMQQPFSAPQPASAPVPAVMPAVMPASQPQASAAPAMSMQPGGIQAASAAAVALVPYPVIQTGQPQVAMLQQLHGPGRPQATVQGGIMPTPLPHSQAMPASTPAPSMAPVQAQAAIQRAPISQHGPTAASAAAGQQQQQPPAAAQASSAAAPATQTAAPAVPAAPQSAAQPQQPPVQPAKATPVEAGKGQPQVASSQAQPPHKAAPKQVTTPAASANPAAAPASAGLLGKAAGAAPAAQAVLPQQQQAPKQPAGTPPSAAAAASASSQKAGPAVGTRSSSALSPGRPQRATRSMAAKR